MMKIDLKSQKGIGKETIIILVIVIVVVVAIACGAFIFLSNNNGYKLDVNEHETVAYTSLRLAIVQGELYGSSTFSAENMEILKKLVKRVDSNNQWFSSNTGVFYGGNSDTSDYQITWISDGNWCAIFYVKKMDNLDYYLTNYNFSADDVEGCMLFVE